MTIISDQLKNMPTVPREKMSRLFSMQIHAAIAGIGLGALWVIVFMSLYLRGPDPILQNDGLAILAAISCLLCFIISAVIATNHSSEESRKETTDAACGWLLRICSALTLVGMCIIIIGSAGIKSPFMPLYIMTFTLTLENLSPEASKSRFTIIYISAAMFACLIANYFPIVNPNFIKKIGDDNFTIVSTAIGLLMSLVVPAVSAHLLAVRAKSGRK